MIKAIPTTYAGVRFRSKLEAKYAKAFDYYGIQWDYETIGLNINGEYYLPDFWLPEGKTFFEVKGPHKERLDVIGKAQKEFYREPCDFDFDLDHAERRDCGCSDCESFWYPTQVFVVGDEFGGLELSPMTIPEFCKCLSCGSYFFRDGVRGRGCRACASGNPDLVMRVGGEYPISLPRIVN